jgi:hypothetical protein
MSKFTVEFTEKGIERVTTTVSSIAEEIASSELSARVALPLRLLHLSAQGRSPVPPSSFKPGPELYLCLCGERFSASADATQHVRQDHMRSTARPDADILERLVEALVVPAPVQGEKK